MLTRRAAASLFALGLCAGGLALGGCSAERSQLFWARMDPTPELRTLDARNDDIKNGLALNTSTQMRELNGDISRVLLINRASRLAPEPVR